MFLTVCKNGLIGFWDIDVAKGEYIMAKKRKIVTVTDEDMDSQEALEGIPTGGFREVNLGQVDLDDTEFEFRVDQKLKDLVEDIKKNGQQFPVILRKKEGQNKYQVISGFRRCRSLQSLGWPKVKAIVHDDLTDEKAYTISFIENERRKSLTGVDKAHAIAKLNLKGKSPKEIQDIYGIGQKQFERYKKVDTFPKELKDAIGNSKIKTTHGLLLMQAYEIHKEKMDLTEWIDWIVESEASTRLLQRQINQELGKPKKQKRYFEKKKGGGFRLYPMQFDPQKTAPDVKDKMIEKLRIALELLEK